MRYINLLLTLTLSITEQGLDMTFRKFWAHCCQWPVLGSCCLQLFINCYPVINYKGNVVCDSYQEDGHLGSLRSPLRTDTGRMGRFRGLRNRDQTRAFSPEQRWRAANQFVEAPEDRNCAWHIDRYVLFCS